MNRIEWDRVAEEKLAIIRQQVIEGKTIMQAVEAAGISYHNEYVRYVSRELRAEIKRSKKNDPINFETKKPAYDKPPIVKLKPEVEQRRDELIALGISPEVAPGMASRQLAGFVKEDPRELLIKKQQIRLNLYAIIQQVHEPEIFPRTVAEKLSDLVSRGLITQEQRGRFEFCFKGIEKTFVTIN